MPLPRQFSRRPLVAAALLVAIGVTGCAKTPPKKRESSAREPDSSKVVAIGSLKPAGGLISISGAPGDRVKALDPDVALNQAVPTNGVLGLMASYDTRLAQIEALQTKKRLAAQKHELDTQLAVARVASAAASVAQAEAKLAEVRTQEKRLAHLQEAADIASEDFRLLTELDAADPELVTDHQFRRQQHLVDKAQTDVAVARQSFESGLAAARGARDAAIANQSAAQQSLAKLREMDPVLAVDEEIKLARQALAQSVLLTPNIEPSTIDATSIKLEDDGAAEAGAYTVLRLFLRPGEAVTQTPVMQVADLSKIVCVAEVYETDAKKIAERQKVKITSKAFKDFGVQDGKWIDGTVESVSRVVASAGIVPRNPLAPVDRSVVEVRIAIDPTDDAAMDEARRWIGLQVQVSFEEQ